MLNMQNDFTEKMWNLENEYNDPSAQMDRLTAAGINPIDAASGVSGNAGNAASVTSSAAPSVPQISGTPIMDTNLGDSLLQGALIPYQIEAQQYQNKIAREEWLQKQMDTSFAPIEKYFKSEQWRADLKNSMAQYKLTNKQVEELTYTIDKLLPENRRVTKATADNMEATAKLTLGQLQKNNEEIENLKKARDEIQARITNYNQSTDLMSAQQADVEADKQLKDDQHELNKIDKRIKDLEESNAKLTNEYKTNLSEQGYDPDQKFNYGSPTQIAHAESLRRQINKLRDYKAKVKYIEKWNKEHPTQQMRINKNNEVEFVRKHNNKKKSNFTYNPIDYGY